VYKKGMKKISVYIQEQLIEKLDRLSKETGVKRSELIRRAIEKLKSE